MARPKYDSDEIPVELRLEEAFWALIERFPLKEITVNMIVAEAKCTRGSFYYHFTDMNALLETVIAHNFPSQIPHILLSMVMTEDDVLLDQIADPLFVRKIDRVCLLVGSHSSIEAVASIKRTIRDVWLNALELDEKALQPEVGVIFEFLINGIVGVLAYRSQPNVRFDIATCMKALMPIPQTFVKHLLEITQR
jgi:AcrR family transcriptional regulator